MAKTKTEFTKLAVAVADEIRSHRRHVLDRAEQLMRAALEEGRPLDYSELDYLTTEAGFDRIKINEETRRINRVIRLQMTAGTASDRAKLSEQVTDAQADLATRCPAIADQIAALQAELAAVEKKASQLTRRQEEVTSALEGLSACVPPLVQAAVAAKRGAIKQSIGRALSDAQVDLQEARVLVAGPKDSTDSFYWENLRRYDRELVSVSVDGQVQSYGYSAAWPAKKAELVESIPQREHDIQLLQAQLDEELAALQAELQQYWR